MFRFSDVKALGSILIQIRIAYLLVFFQNKRSYLNAFYEQLSVKTLLNYIYSCHLYHYSAIFGSVLVPSY